MRRRAFLASCAMLSSGALAQTSGAPRLYRRARLVTGSGTPLKAASLAVNRAYVFHYPFAGTPSFLINLGRPVTARTALRTAGARTYEWQGGVGAARSIVAYSAICSHRLTYPTKEISFISFREKPTPASKHAQVIHCCSEHSQYDPSRGAEVVAGPAPQPLAAILLEHDAATDGLVATGTLGAEMFDEFFTRFAMRLELEHGGRARQPTDGECQVTELAQYCRQQVKC